jgi:hypothetical protein
MVDDIRGNRPRPEEDVADEPSFAPPEVVAEDEVVVDMGENEESTPKGNKGQEPKKPGKMAVLMSNVKSWWGKRKQKERVAIVVGITLGLAVAGFGIYKLTRKPTPAKPAPVVKKEEVKEPPKPTTEASKLTGVQVAPELNQLTVTGVMIENSPDARPQSGLKDAGVVFEAIAEGGITRFLALFQEAQPDYIGPVRSVRPYYVSWLEGFDAAIAHAGGSGEGLAKLKRDGVKDLDQFFNGGAYQRITSRYAPHNLYTSRGSLLALEKSKGFTTSSFTGFARKGEKAITPTTAKSINFTISSPLYSVHYDYDAAGNNYRRVLGGQAHTDERSGAQITPKVVIAIVVSYGIDADGIHSDYNTIGSGKAYIFQDGGVTQGTWSKSSDKDQIHFGDANGAPLGLNPGQTWISAVDATSDVAFIP